jgi:hypothetical protein
MFNQLGALRDRLVFLKKNSRELTAPGLYVGSNCTPWDLTPLSKNNNPGKLNRLYGQKTRFGIRPLTTRY